MSVASLPAGYRRASGKRLAAGAFEHTEKQQRSPI